MQTTAELRDAINEISICSLLDCLGVRYREVRNGEFEIFVDDEYKSSYKGNIKKNIVKDFSTKGRPEGSPYKYLVEFISYFDLDTDPYHFYLRNKDRLEKGEGITTFERDESKYSVGKDYIVADTEAVHPSVSFTADDLIRNRKKHEIPESWLKKLEARGIRRETLIGEDIFYGAITETGASALLFLSKNGNGEDVGVKIRNLFAKNKKFKSYSLTNSRVGLFYNKEYLSTENVYLCEGEMDYLILRQMGYANVLANMGGVQAFMRDWLNLLKGKNIHILYDNDDAGTKGMEKAVRIIQNEIAGEFKSLKISNFGKPGEDINDTYLRMKQMGMKDFDIGKVLFDSMKEIDIVDKV